MLYLVQMVISGTITPPRIFADQTCAQANFVALVREHCAAAFAEYCANNGADPESFVAARAFAGTWDEKDTCFSYWEQSLETAAETAPRLQLPLQNREPLQKNATEIQQKILGVQTELRGLTEMLSGLSQELIRLQKLLDSDGGGAVSDEVSDAPEVSKLEAETLDEKYQTAAWQDFVQSLIQMCGGNWGEFPLLSRPDWRQAVYSGQTSLQYWEWVAITIDLSIARAKADGYSIEEDSRQKGHFAYLTPAGERSSTLYEMEDLAWCAAGLHAAQEDGKQA